MTNTPNPHYISQNATGSSLTQPVDTVDFPHSGLIKALNQMAAGNVVVKTGTDFDINQTGGNLVVAAGKILRNGKYHEVATKTFADSSLTTTYAKGYHLLVVADGREGGETVDVLYMRPPTANERVPEFKLGDTIVAMIEYSSATSAGSRLIQYFTTNKESNSLSIAYANSNVYTQAMTVDSDSNGHVTFENVAQDRDLVFKVNDGGASTEVLRISGDDGYVGIGGITAPSAQLHIRSSLTQQPELRLENTNADAQEAVIRFMKNTASPAASDDIGLIRFEGENDAGGNHLYGYILGQMLDTTNTAEAGEILFFTGHKGGQYQVLAITGSSAGDGEVCINDGGRDDINFRVEGDTEQYLIFTDAANDRVAIGHSSPTALLDMETGGTFRNTRLLTVSVSASTTLTEAAHAGRYNICAGNVTLPSSSTAGEHYAILNTTGGDITIGRNGNNINGAGSDVTLGTYKAATCIAIGSNNWIVIGV